MNRRLVALSAIAVVALIVSSSQAQPPQGRGGMRGGRGMGSNSVGLLVNKSVRDEIKVTDEQMEKIHKMRGSMRPSGDRPQVDRKSFQDMSQEERQEMRKEMGERREKMQAQMEEMQKKIGSILDKEQMKRLRQIEMQRMGIGVLRNPRVAKALKITDEQKEKMQNAMREMRPTRGEGQDRPQPAARQEMQEKMKSLMDEILTSEQKATLKKLQGKPFDVSKLQQGRGGQRGQRGQGRPGGRGGRQGGQGRPGGQGRGQQ